MLLVSAYSQCTSPVLTQYSHAKSRLQQAFHKNVQHWVIKQAPRVPELNVSSTQGSNLSILHAQTAAEHCLFCRVSSFILRASSQTGGRQSSRTSLTPWNHSSGSWSSTARILHHRTKDGVTQCPRGLFSISRQDQPWQCTCVTRAAHRR